MMSVAQRLVVSIILVTVVKVIDTHATSLSECPNSPLFYGSYKKITCKGSGGNGSSFFNWTLTQIDSGNTLHVGTCRLKPYHHYSILNSIYVRCSSLSSSLEFHDLQLEYSGLLTCTETMANLTVQSASCQLSVSYVQIVPCPQRGLEAKEEDSFSSYCFHSPYLSPSELKWTLFRNNGLVEELGTCQGAGNCSNSSFHPNVFLGGRSHFKGLRFNSRLLQRGHAGILHCSFTYNGTTQTDTCPLVIYNYPHVNCSMSLQTHNWSMAAICDVTKFFSTNGNYEFQVKDYFTLFKGDVNVSTSSDITDTQPVTDLKSYMDSNDNRVYYEGRLYISWPLLALPGMCRGWDVYFYPGGATAYSSLNLTVLLPSTPSISCEEVESGGCTCVTEDLGSPPGRLQWRRGRVILSTGPYGSKKLVLPSSSFDKNGSVTVSCVLDWIETRNATISFLVFSTANDPAVTPSSTTSTDTSMDSDQQTCQEGGTTWAAIGVAALLMVIVVVGVVVIVVLCRTGRLTCSKAKSSATVEYDASEEQVYTHLRLPPPTKKKMKGKSKPVPAPDIRQHNSQAEVHVNDACNQE